MASDDGAGVTRLVAERAVSLAYEGLPQEVVELIKQIVLDTLGVAIGASGLAPEAQIVASHQGHGPRADQQAGYISATSDSTTSLAKGSRSIPIAANAAPLIQGDQSWPCQRTAGLHQ